MPDKLLELALNQVRNISKNDQILQVGPDKDTTEFTITPAMNNQEAKTGYFRFKTCNDCSGCPYYLACKKRIALKNGRLPYKANAFDKVLLLADSNYRKESLLNDAVKVLKTKGQLILFAKGKNANNFSVENSFCFSVEDIVSQINLNLLEIESISTIRVTKTTTAMCLVASKN